MRRRRRIHMARRRSTLRLAIGSTIMVSGRIVQIKIGEAIHGGTRIGRPRDPQRLKKLQGSNAPTLCTGSVWRGCVSDSVEREET